MNDSKIKIPMIAWMKLDNTISGFKLRKNYPHRNDGLTPILLVTKSIQLGDNQRIKLIRTQFPLTPAFAMTIHKSQGQSYSNVSVHVKKGMSRSLLYVALSRSRTLMGLNIFMDDSSKSLKDVIPTIQTQTAKDIDEEIERLRRNSLKPIFSEVCENPPYISYQNIQSFRRHGYMLMKDPVFNSADIVIFVETWLTQTDSVEIGNRQVVRLDCSDGERGKGIMVLVSQQNPLSLIMKKRFKSGIHSMDIVWFSHLSLTVMVVYKQCGLPTGSMIDVLELIINDHSIIPDLIIGDFNIDLRNMPHSLKSWFLKRTFKSLCPLESSTSNSGTTIDAAFSVSKIFHAVIYENLLTHHFPLIIYKNCIRNIHEPNI